MGQGSTFWFELPITRSENFIPPEESPSKDYHHQILLVEDDASIAQVIQIALADDGFNVHHVSTIAEAEAKLKGNTFHAVILDIGLPDGNGLELLEHLRICAETQAVPVVVVTASLPMPEKFSDPLLIDWITKPFDEKRLLRAVQLAVRGRTEGVVRVLIVEDDRATRDILRQQISSLGVQILEAADGDEAIEQVRKENPDLIILDLGLPGTNGFDVVTVLRHENARNTPLLVYTAQDLSKAEISALTLGLSAHLTKSRTSEEKFLGTVRDLLNGLIKPKSDA